VDPDRDRPLLGRLVADHEPTPVGVDLTLLADAVHNIPL
jgi:hypothetical protein